jgi:hypothetical protein
MLFFMELEVIKDVGAEIRQGNCKQYLQKSVYSVYRSLGFIR